MNRVLLTGRLTREPVLRYTPQGTPVVEFALAVEPETAGRGRSRLPPVEVEVIAPGATAAALAGDLRPGSGVVVEGRLRNRAGGGGRGHLEVEASRLERLGEEAGAGAKSPRRSEP